MSLKNMLQFPARIDFLPPDAWDNWNRAVPMWRFSEVEEDSADSLGLQLSFPSRYSCCGCLYRSGMRLVPISSGLVC